MGDHRLARLTEVLCERTGITDDAIPERDTDLDARGEFLYTRSDDPEYAQGLVGKIELSLLYQGRSVFSFNIARKGSKAHPGCILYNTKTHHLDLRFPTMEGAPGCFQRDFALINVATNLLYSDVQKP